MTKRVWIFGFHEVLTIKHTGSPGYSSEKITNEAIRENLRNADWTKTFIEKCHVAGDSIVIMTSHKDIKFVAAYLRVLLGEESFKKDMPNENFKGHSDGMYYQDVNNVVSCIWSSEADNSQSTKTDNVKQLIDTLRLAGNEIILVAKTGSHSKSPKGKYYTLVEVTEDDSYMQEMEQISNAPQRKDSYSSVVDPRDAQRFFQSARFKKHPEKQPFFTKSPRNSGYQSIEVDPSSERRCLGCIIL